ncbi:bifunctional DNA primase/polymerase [Streptomyces polyrhachis]|uniref:Bifunctional DNA primase/polymerase n=1 Tax=Streptomyces polyrhachis TaxID=1282885 RepID=A0ABW2GHD6_9ACTN
MGFTIGGIRDIRSVRRGRSFDGTTVAEYTGLWGWDVRPGARLVRGECSCGLAGCLSPGDHPLADAPAVPAGSTLDAATAAWARTPGASVLLPVGRSFDVLDVDARAGRRALVRLERMGLPLGPVSVTPAPGPELPGAAPGGRAYFFVAPGAAARLPQLLYRTGWDYADLDLRCLGPGDHIPAPPSDYRGLGPVRWLRPPTLDAFSPPALPQARLLLGTLAYVSHRAGI